MAYSKNAWYRIARSDEVRKGIFTRTILELPVITFPRPSRPLGLTRRWSRAGWVARIRPDGYLQVRTGFEKTDRMVQVLDDMLLDA